MNPIKSIRHIVVNNRKWMLYDYIAFFYDSGDFFEHCVSSEVLSRLEKDGNRHHITLEECEGYLRFSYGRVPQWEGT